MPPTLIESVLDALDTAKETNQKKLYIQVETDEEAQMVCDYMNEQDVDVGDIQIRFFFRKEKPN